MATSWWRGMTKISRIHLLGIMNIWTEFHGNPFRTCWDHSVWNWMRDQLIGKVTSLATEFSFKFRTENNQQPITKRPVTSKTIVLLWCAWRELPRVAFFVVVFRRVKKVIVNISVQGAGVTFDCPVANAAPLHRCFSLACFEAAAPVAMILCDRGLYWSLKGLSASLKNWRKSLAECWWQETGNTPPVPHCVWLHGVFQYFRVNSSHGHRVRLTVTCRCCDSPDQGQRSSTHGLETFNPSCSPLKQKDGPRLFLQASSSPSLLHFLFFNTESNIIKIISNKVGQTWKPRLGYSWTGHSQHYKY